MRDNFVDEYNYQLKNTLETCLAVLRTFIYHQLVNCIFPFSEHFVPADTLLNIPSMWSQATVFNC